MTKAYCTMLPNRAAVALRGPDARALLQGLVTQDMARLDSSPLLYAALLTPQGKFDADFFVHEAGGAVILDCAADRAAGIAKKLALYRLRKAVEIETGPLTVCALWGDENALKAFPYPADPRHAGLGLRAYVSDLSDITGTEAGDYDFYDRLRLTLGVPDGARDFAAGEDTVADMGLEKLDGVSFTKGCYMGQELTSRMHHRALSKKGLYAVRITGPALPPFTDIVADGNLIGEMRSSNGDVGLAMLRHDSLLLAPKAGLDIGFDAALEAR